MQVAISALSASKVWRIEYDAISLEQWMLPQYWKQQDANDALASE